MPVSVRYRTLAKAEPCRDECRVWLTVSQNLLWVGAYNVLATTLAAGALYSKGVLLTPALGGALMAASTVIKAINARLLRQKSNSSGR